MDWMIAYGAKQFVSAGSCGALIDLPENTFIVPRRALRDEGTSYHYMPPHRWSFLDYALQQRIVDVFREKNVAYTECDTWTTDAIYRETVDKVRRCRAEGCGVVDMECAALSAVAEFRNVSLDSSCMWPIPWPTRTPMTPETGARIRWRPRWRFASRLRDGIDSFERFGAPWRCIARGRHS